jgi:hypothetical protein
MPVDLKKPYEVYALSEPLAQCLVVRVTEGFKGKLVGIELVSLDETTERVRLDLEVTRQGRKR